MKLSLCPLAIDRLGARAPGGKPLAGGPLGFGLCEAVVREGREEKARALLPPDRVVAWASGIAPALADQAETLLARLSAPRPAFAGLDPATARIMGVINVTPDSFSDGGDRFDPGRAVADGLALREAGAQILDIGGELTRPGADPVDPEEELRRVVPVVRTLAQAGALVSIDSRRARVMAEALDAGARIVNDVTALTDDPESLPLVARAEAPLVLMHMQGEPRSMQNKPVYDDAPRDIYDWLAARIAACESAGIARTRIAVDPGIGFGKTVAHNLQILERLALFHGLGCVLLLGVSRKSFIGRLSKNEPPKERIPGSLAAALAGVARGAQILRVHDVAETRQALSIWHAVEAAADPTADLGAPTA